MEARMATQAREHGFCLWNDEWPLTLAEDEPELRADEAVELQDVPVTVAERGDAVILRAELPGLVKEEIDLEVSRDAITISARHAAEAGKARPGPREPHGADCSRTVALPVEIETADVTAELEGGVLEVRAHRKPAPGMVHVEVRMHHA
jgi:HSP20 family molecular chaperone IbpA